MTKSLLRMTIFIGGVTVGVTTGVIAGLLLPFEQRLKLSQQLAEPIKGMVERIPDE